MRLLAVFLLGTAFAAAQGTLADYQRAAAMKERWETLATGSPGDAQWLDANRLWYPVSTAKGTAYVMADRTGQKSPAFDATRLASSLSAVLGRVVDPEKLPLAGLRFVDSGKAIEFQAGEKRWRADLTTYMVRDLGDRPMFGNGPRVPEDTQRVASPDGSQQVFLRNYNIWLRAKGMEIALSTDGSEFDYYALSRSAWSPDGKRVAVYRIRPGYRRKISMVESSPADQVQPRLKTIPYVKPGDVLDLPRPVLFDIDARRQFRIDDTLFPNPYQMSAIQWRKDSRAFHFNYNERGHQVWRVVEVDAMTGRARAVVEEKSSTFFCYYSKLFRHDWQDGREVIWMSERDGWNHLYLYDGATGKVKNQITKGKWVVRSVVAVDDNKRQIYFLGSGMDPTRDPYLRHLFRINFDGSDLQRFSILDADHTATVSPDFERYTLTYSSLNKAPVMELRDPGDRSLVKVLEKVEMGPLDAAGWRAPEAFVSKARDGETDIWGVIYKPSQFDPARKYPVLEYIYAGPHDSFVPKRFAAMHPMQEMAELGFIVVQMDGMGTSNRSKAFHDIAWKNIGDAGFPDRIRWHQAVAAKHPWYDLSRLGIYGHSAGGQNALGAMLRHGDLYKAAASSAGCHDNRMDKMSWNEQWMSWPVGPEYAASSNVEMAKNLKGKLLLAVGELDTNVDPASTMQVVNALIKAGKVFDLLVIPGADHGLGTYWERKRKDFFVKTFLGVDPPDWNQLAGN